MSTTKRQPAGNLSVEELNLLVQQVAVGDEAALRRLIEQYRPLVKSITQRQGLNGMDLEDVMQETWLQFMTHAGSIRQPECLPAWLKQTAKNASLSRIRQRSRTVPTDNVRAFDVDQGDADPCADAVAGRLTGDIIRRAMDRLNERDRTLVKLIMTRTPYRIISQRLGIPMGSIGPTRERILGKLAHCCEVRSLAA